MDVKTSNRPETPFPSEVTQGQLMRDPLAGRPPSQTTRTLDSRSKSLPIERWLMRRALLACGSPAIRIVLWDGETIVTSRELPLGNVVVNNRGALRRLILDPRLGFGDGYSDGSLEIQGSLVDVLSAITLGLEKPGPGLFSRVLRRPRRRRSHSLTDSRESVHHHYDIGNDFYRLWLDERMQYTCAYYARPHFTLEEAQLAKLDHVCRKLRLKAGERVVEAGCGWGGLALYMAQQYGVSVRAFNLSREQVAYARRGAEERGISRQVEFVHDDYRNITGKYDAFISIGMLEHVGLDQFDELGRVLDRSLAPHGRGLIHSIGRNAPRPLDLWIDRRIFPGAYPPAISEMMRIFEPRGFSVLDVENLRLHYARTLEHWLERFERSAEQISAMFDARFVRMWRMYLAGSIAAFLVGSLQLFQFVFSREKNNDVPWTREHLYPTGA